MNDVSHWRDAPWESKRKLVEAIFGPFPSLEEWLKTPIQSLGPGAGDALEARSDASNPRGQAK